MDFSKITNIKVEDIDHSDCPDYCDAFIASCDIDGRDATESELEEINDNPDFVYEAVMDYLY